MKSTSGVNRATAVLMPYMFLHNITFQQHYGENCTAIPSDFMKSTPGVNSATAVVMPYMFLHNITFQKHSTSGVGILLILAGRARPSAPSHVSRLLAID